MKWHSGGLIPRRALSIPWPSYPTRPRRSFFFSGSALDPVKRFHRNPPHETLLHADEAVFPVHEDSRKPTTDIKPFGSASGGLVMWWALIVSFVFIAPVVKTIEEWRLHRGAQRDLIEMRKHAASGHKWDVTQGRWVG
jgi:hypothetical protein